MAGCKGKSGKGKVMSKSQAAKQAAAGVDMGKPGKGFKAGVESIVARGGSPDSAKRIMGAQFQKMRRKGKL